LVWKVADKVRDEDLLAPDSNREGNGKLKPVKNLIRSGGQILRSSTLRTFNKRMNAFINGHEVIWQDDDTLPPTNFAPNESTGIDSDADPDNQDLVAEE
jgi:hypothetical protein